MPRIRTIKPEFWTDGTMVQLSALARLFYIGTWNFAMCDAGHIEDDALRLKLQILPAENCDVEALIDELVDAGRLDRIKVDTRSYLHIRRLPDHQKTDARWTPRCPVCTHEASLKLTDTHASSGETHRASPKHSAVKERKGKEGKVTTSSADADGVSLTVLDRFGEFWDAYDKKTGRKKSEAKYRLALRKRGVTEDLLIEAAKRYVASQRAANKHPEFTKDPATWLNGEHWNDAPSQHAPAAHSWATALEVGYCGTCGGDVDIDGTGHHDGCPKRRRA